MWLSIWGVLKDNVFSKNLINSDKEFVVLLRGLEWNATDRTDSPAMLPIKMMIYPPNEAQDKVSVSKSFVGVL